MDDFNFNPVLDGSMLDGYGGTVDSSGDTGTTWDSSAGSSTWDGFVQTGGDYDGKQNVPTLFNADSSIGKASADFFGGDIFSKMTGAASDFWNGGGDAKQAANNKGLIGSVLQGVGSGYMQSRANEKSVKLQIDAVREKQKFDAAEREKYSSVPADFAKNVTSRKTFGV